MGIHDYLRLVRRHLAVLIVIPLVFGAIGFWSSNNDIKKYRSSAEVLLRPNDPNERVGSTGGTGTEILNADRIVEAQRSIAEGPNVRQMAAKELGNITPARLIKVVRVSASSSANILVIAATDPSPDRAADIANKMATAFIENRRQAAVSGLEAVIADLEKRIDEVSKQIATVSKTQVETSKSIELSSLQAQFQSLLDRRLVLQAENDIKRNRGEAESAVAGAQMTDLDRRASEIGTEISRLAKLQVDISKQGELTTAQSQLQSLSDRRLQLLIDKELKKGEAELISSALPAIQAMSPTPKRSAALAALLGIMAVVSFILLRDRLDTRLRSREEAEALSGLSTLAEVPLSKGDLGIAAASDPNGVVAESIRSLRVSLRFLGLDKPLKVVLITSAMPGDGKSTVATNLAHSYAESGARTLLVSADLRRPQIERMVEIENDRGLVELLNAMAEARDQSRIEATSGRAVTRSRSERLMASQLVIANSCFEGAPNLFILPAGRRVANPVEILGSPVAKEFFERAAQDFDMVIVDSPPVMAVSDAVVLSEFMDGVIIVASEQKTHRQALSRAMEVLRGGQPNVLGLVFNRVQKGGYRYDGYYGEGHNGKSPSKPARARRSSGRTKAPRRAA